MSGVRTRDVALVIGDGAAPEMMRAACTVVQMAASLDGLNINFVETPMGWNAYTPGGDTLPAESLKAATKIGTLFFGGVGDPVLDNAIGSELPQLRPEARALLTIRKEWGLLLNYRPMVFYPELAALSPLRPDVLPKEPMEQIFVRFLLEDSYFGTRDLAKDIGQATTELIGLRQKHQVTGREAMVSELSYYRGDTVRKYFTSVFQEAQKKNLPVICVDKSNIMPRYVYWRKIAQEVGKEFPHVPLSFQLVDSAAALLFEPTKLQGVIACGNEHGDILSDGAAAAVGGMGLMCSSAINPDNGMAMFESGAGTAPTLAGKDQANPLGRILTGALMLRHLGAPKGAAAIERAVRKVIGEGFRTADIMPSETQRVLFDRNFIPVGTQGMANAVRSAL